MDNNTNQSNKQPSPKPKGGGNSPKQPFNPYWIYTIIFLALMGLYFFGGDTTKKEISWSDFQRYVNEDRIENVVVFTNKETAEAKVRPESVGVIFGNQTPNANKNPIITVHIPSTEVAAEFLDKVKAEKEYDIEVRFDRSSEIWGIILSSLPFILLIVFWIWWMRKMAQGGPAGGGGGIFS
ncbi:MAG: ftsH, partial [Dysgonamonadaceae bacterium]|nr:ftsH [Dysgonamonadaceae bacterium]